MWKWTLRIVLALFAGLAIACAVLLVYFDTWLAQIATQRLAGSTMAETARGPVEYAQLGEGPAVLFSHGTPGGFDESYFALRITHAAKNGFHYVAVSRPGYLGTPLRVGVTPADQADAFAALLDKLGIKKTAIIAQSGGGPAALQFALRHPERCSALVLESALVRNYEGPVPVLPKSAFGGWLRDIVIFAFKDMGIAQYQASDPNDPLITTLAQAAVSAVVPYGLHKAGIENDLAQERALDGWPLNQITCPTLIVHGAVDQSAPIADAEYAHQEIPNSELVVLPGQDHMMAIVKHKQVDELILTFLRKYS